MGRKILRLIRSFAVLYLMLFLGERVSALLPIGVPGSIWGLLLLFVGLTTQVIKVKWVMSGASLLIRYMAVLFVPVSVGIVKYSDLLITQADVLLIPNIFSTFITLILIGWFADYLFSLNSFSRLRRKILHKRVKGLR